MHLLSYLSDFLIPMLIFYVVSCGLAAHLPVYDIFVKGASRGGKTVLKVLPTLVGLMVSVGMLRASGFSSGGRASGSPGGLDSYAGAAGSIGISPPLFFFCGHFPCTGYLQILWNGFGDRYDGVHYDGLHGNGFLYYECLFSHRKSIKNPLDAGRSIICHGGWYRSQCGSGASRVICTKPDLKIINMSQLTGK